MLLGYARVSDPSQNHNLQLDAFGLPGAKKVATLTMSEHN
jgi:hypothetical protein